MNANEGIIHSTLLISLDVKVRTYLIMFTIQIDKALSCLHSILILTSIQSLISAQDKHSFQNSNIIWFHTLTFFFSVQV
jgi:hypothetical protein